MTTIRDLQIRRLEPSDAALYREIRLEGLRISPEAFGSTFEKESVLPLSWFEALLGRTAIFGAFVDGTLAGATATMDEVVRRAAGFLDVGLEAAIPMATRTPARALGLPDLVALLARRLTDAEPPAL